MNETDYYGEVYAYEAALRIAQERGDDTSAMEAAYEDREDIRDLVAEVVDTYHPAGEHGTEEKGSAYEKQRAAMQQKLIAI